jgi:hypothetical protein
MQLRGRIEDNDGNTICEVRDVLKVDCCLKDSENREVKLYDESLLFGPSRPWVLLGGNKYYETPDIIIDLDNLFWYGAFSSGAFWTLPEYHGGCLPFTWSLTGPGELIPATEDGISARYIPPSDWNVSCQNQSVIIRVKDRCNTEDLLITDNCCETHPALSIGYTTLLMSCNQSQQLEAVGGCGWYRWSIVSGGGSLNVTDGQYVTYTAPATNANCTSNPTIKVEDCCGHSATVKFAINCYAVSATALIYCSLIKESECLCTSCTDQHCFHTQFWADYDSTTWDCEGDVRNTCSNEGNFGIPGGYYEDTYCIPIPDCVPAEMPKTCTNDICMLLIEDTANCNWLPWCSECYNTHCNTLTDKRTAAMKTGGCCPINPFTGLPYD